MHTGWQCPVCGRIWGPTVKECKECNKFVPIEEFKRPYLPPFGTYVYATPLV